jgi:hypothetical protein
MPSHYLSLFPLSTVLALSVPSSPIILPLTLRLKATALDHQWPNNGLRVCLPWMQSLITDKLKTLTHIPRILALDGGGVRGLSSLLIVRRLMHEVQRIMITEGNTTDDGKLPRPCEYFDLICGTSTGGLIAIMLGRLRMVSETRLASN